MQLNKKQKYISILLLTGNFIMGLFPPWETSIIRSGILASFNSGYHPIWSPPKITSSINTTTLLVQVLAFSALCLTVLFITGTKTRDNN